jgi:hypothetical protein
MLSVFDSVKSGIDASKIIEVGKNRDLRKSETSTNGPVVARGTLFFGV